MVLTPYYLSILEKIKIQELHDYFDNNMEKNRRIHDTIKMFTFYGKEVHGKSHSHFAKRRIMGKAYLEEILFLTNCFIEG